MSIKEGEFVALIGPNGAGKTTLIKMLTGIIAPTSGEISVLGYTPNDLKDEFKQNYAIVMGQKSQLFNELTAADTFLLLKEIYSIPEADYKKNIEYFTQLFDVKEYLNVQVRTLSLGERMKMELIAALLNNPKILFLDEPTIGLDAIAQKKIRGFLKEVNRDKNTTKILTSHYMEDVKSLCKRCVVINGGLKLYDSDLAALFERYQLSKVMKISFEDATEYTPPADAEIIEQNPYKIVIKVKKNNVRAVLNDIMAKCEIDDISIEEEDIGDVVERIYHNHTDDEIDSDSL